MSNRTLVRMKDSEITAIIDTRAKEIADAMAQRDALAERREFAHEVAKNFHYNDLRNAVEAELPQAPVDVYLLKLLQSLGIRPFEPSSVARYMRSKVSRKLEFACSMVGRSAIGAGVIFALALIIFAIFTQTKPSVLILLGGAIAGAGWAFLGIKEKLVPERSWQVQDLSRKGRLIPREALEIALKIKKAAPQDIRLEFRVHELIETYGTILPDPFLEVSWYGGESYFIAVWDEPGFDKKLLEVD